MHFIRQFLTGYKCRIGFNGRIKYLLRFKVWSAKYKQKGKKKDVFHFVCVKGFMLLTKKMSCLMQITFSFGKRLLSRFQKLKNNAY